MISKGSQRVFSIFAGLFMAISFLFSGPLDLASAQVTVAIGQNFTASTLNVDSSAVPPDPNGFAGPLHYVELINGRFSVYDKSTGSKVKTMTDLTFWNQAGLSFPSGWDVTDPRIFFDPASQRWFASQVDFDPSGTVNTNRFLLAVSATADPTGTWKALGILSDPGGNNFADFPTLGMDAQAIYLGGDMFDSNSFPVGPTLLSIPKSSLTAAPPTTNGMTWLGILNYDVRGDILQPAICLDGSDQGTVLSTSGVGVDNSGNIITNNSLVSFRIQNVTGVQKATLTAPSVLTVQPYTAPLDPTQPDNSSNLSDNDSRFSACVYEVGGVLYAVHGTQVGNRAALRWYRIDASSHAILETGTVADPVLDLFFPSIAANPAGTVVIGYNASSISTFVSSFALVGNTVGGVTTFGQPLLLKSGVASYQNTDSSGSSRWGDYSATCVDPSDPNVFWTIQEFPSSASRWSTQVTQLLTGFPTLFSSVSSNKIALSWSGTLFSLQTTEDLAHPNWSAVSQTSSTNHGTVSVQLPVSAGAFFRLKGP
ncbi:MAG TPA: hypothetical protein VKY92_14215 [Verrucomicrobiae bacterium]|nr:hypothetical protein [Verrucomicrobiae bacterium]